jgi:predicted Holliday junction resolvase-like endonuclease
MNELFESFKEFRKILCVCPCCNEIHRLSDLHIKFKGSVSKTWLDEFDKEKQILEEKERKFGEQEEKLREIAREKGRKEAEKVFNKAILPSIRALKFDPYDIKPILNPIDFVVFRGMNKDENVKEIIFLSKMNNFKVLNESRKQIEKVILQQKYDWQVARIEENGKLEFE